uniref:Uncharacterized protein n=1 Tax=Meloidogyne incognita TaxID=6306 RepID=A0A914NLH6_MELIC
MLGDDYDLLHHHQELLAVVVHLDFHCDENDVALLLSLVPSKFFSRLSITTTIRINNTFARRSILSFSSPTIFTSRSTST